MVEKKQILSVYYANVRAFRKEEKMELSCKIATYGSKFVFSHCNKCVSQNLYLEIFQVF